MPDASHDFGAHLRQAREQRGVSLRDIAERTKISVLALEALERNDTSRLPGGIFTRAFVRSYASEVGLDPEDTVRRFLARFPEESTEEGQRTYEPNPERISVDEPPTFGRAWRAVAWSVPLLLVVGYFGFGGRLPWLKDLVRQYAQRSGSLSAPPPPPVATPSAAPAVTPEGTDAGEQAVASGDAAAAAGPGATAPVDTAQIRTDTAADQGHAAARETPAAVPASIPAPQTPATAVASTSPATVPAATPGPPAAGAFRLTLAPREACWVSVRSNGGSVYSGLMRPGERKDLTLQGDVSLTVGNAGAFDYFINDQAGRALGGPGQVATVRLNADSARTLVQPR